MDKVTPLTIISLVQVYMMQVLGITLEQGNKYSLTPKRYPEAKIAQQDTAEPALVTLH